MSERATIAIVGCGAVTERYYLPALKANMERVRVIGFYDSDPARMNVAASGFDGVSRTDSFNVLVDLHADIVILASPPAFHAEQAIAALETGSHVLCEKPMALTVQEAEAMCEAAERNTGILVVNMVRRHFPASRIVETMIRADSLGQLQSISVFEGGAFRWPIRDQSYFSRQVSGGGVLADIGTHVLDLLGAWFGEAELVGYEDDAMGGVEVNARMELRYQDAPTTIRLSRDWSRPNKIDLVFEKARVSWRAERMSEVEVRFNASDPLVFTDKNAQYFSFVDCFSVQINSMLDYIEGKPAHIVVAKQMLPTISLVEQAYALKRPMIMPWLQPSRGGMHDQA